MKGIKGLIILLVVLMLSAPAVTLYAYENVNGDSPNCLDCHSSQFTGTSSWHTNHLLHASGNCAKCHSGVPGSSELPHRNAGTVIRDNPVTL